MNINRLALWALFGAVLHQSGRPSLAAGPEPSAPPANTHYGPFGIYDTRSTYGVGVFPEPFIVDDTDLEVNELRLDWAHQEGKGAISDGVTAEVEKGFGLLTLEIEVPYERDSAVETDPPTGRVTHPSDEGIANIDVGARLPVFQYVSPNGSLDTTFGVAFEIGIPTNSVVSKNTEIVPKVFNDTRIGDRITVQTIFGYSILKGGGEEGGQESFEYGLVLGYTINHSDLPIPGVQQIIPMLELAGETLNNHAGSGEHSLTGDAAVRFNLNAIGRFQPRIGLGYLFPVDKGAREEFRWGVVTSLIFEF